MRYPIPPELTYVGKVNEFLSWLLHLRVERKIDRKIILCDWCRITGYPLTPELVARVYTHP